ncbi:MAG: sugar-binding domain-containing protein [Verrucomicrobiota bacterium]
MIRSPFNTLGITLLALTAAHVSLGIDIKSDTDSSPVEDAAAAENYTPPSSNRLRFNFNPDWKFIKKDVAGAEKVEVDDRSWTDVSLPHTYNDVDSFNEWRSHSPKNPPLEKMERSFAGKTWYRKHFKLDAAWSGRKVFLEFEGIRNTGKFYINSQSVGMHSDQISPCGLDITDQVKFGAENVIAVQIDNDMLAKDPAGYSYGWSADAFYPNFGGIFKDVSLHITDKLHQTLPLYSNLKTSGVYVYAEKIDTGAGTADLTVESEVANAYDEPRAPSFEFWVVDCEGKEVLRKSAPARAVSAGGKTKFTATAPMTGIHFWSPDYPYLYRVFSALKVAGKLVDVVRSPLGVRKVTFSAKEGLKLNGHPIYLKGYAPRTTMEWAVTGIPQDWMTEYDYKLMKANHANFIRPMHVAPCRNQVESADKFGIILACPAGNGEGDDSDTPQGNARWKDRVEVMRDVTIYFRNNPSIIFYEASNSGVTVKHMQDMVDVRNEWDPKGGRFCGTRATDKTTEAVKEYASPMDGPHSSTLMPEWDAEYARAESPRRIWDKYTPFLDYSGKQVVGGYIKVATPIHIEATAAKLGDGIYEYPEDAFRLNSSEDLALNNLRKYWDRYKLSAFVLPEEERLTKGVCVGGAKIIFSDSNSHGRMYDMEVARVTGVLDGVRLPKESYFAMQVAHNEQPQVHILGHWNYPEGTVKTVWVVCNTDKVKLATYDEKGKLIKDYGWGERDVTDARFSPINQYAFKFKDVVWQPGKIEAVAYNGETQVARQEKVTAGPPANIKLTPVTGPGAFRADGADIAMINVEVVDEKGRRCSTDEGRIDFEPKGAGAFLGGYNSGIRFSKFKNYLNTEAGINRVFVRATRNPGDFTLTATRSGLPPATIKITSEPFGSKDGLTTVYPRAYGHVLGAEPAAVRDDAPMLERKASTALSTSGVMREFGFIRNE